MEELPALLLEQQRCVNRGEWELYVRVTKAIAAIVSAN